MFCIKPLEILTTSVPYFCLFAFFLHLTVKMDTWACLIQGPGTVTLPSCQVEDQIVQLHTNRTRRLWRSGVFCDYQNAFRNFASCVPLGYLLKNLEILHRHLCEFSAYEILSSADCSLEVYCPENFLCTTPLTQFIHDQEDMCLGSKSVHHCNDFLFAGVTYGCTSCSHTALGRHPNIYIFIKFLDDWNKSCSFCLICILKHALHVSNNLMPVIHSDL